MLRIDVYSDTACPWCYLGKRRLAAALAARPRQAPRVVWRPFELNPDLPAEGVDRQAFLAAKIANPQAFEATRQTLIELGRAVGIGFRFDLQGRMPNTRRSHLLIALGARRGRQDEVLERVMQAYFEEGCDIGDVDELVRLGVAAGLDERDASRALVLRSGQDAVLAAERHAGALGLTGVPTFVLNGEYALSGAVETAALTAAMDRVATLPAVRTGQA